MKLLKEKFFKINTSLTFNELASLINTNTYSERKKIGFDMYDYNKNKVIVKYIEESLLKEIIIDPLGNEEEVISKKYIIFNFEIIYFSNEFFLKIFNPPKSLKNFFFFLLKISNNKFFKNNIKLDIDALYKELITLESILRYKVLKINVSDIQISDTSRAKIEITSINNAYLDFKEKYNYSKYLIDKIKIKVRYKGLDELIEFNNLGSISASSNISSLVETIILNQYKN